MRIRWSDIQHIAIYHRLGLVKYNYCCQLAAQENCLDLDAVQHAIDELENSVPIWKKEKYDDSEDSEWKDNKEFS